MIGGQKCGMFNSFNTELMSLTDKTDRRRILLMHRPYKTLCTGVER